MQKYFEPAISDKKGAEKGTKLLRIVFKYKWGADLFL